MEQSLP